MLNLGQFVWDKDKLYLALRVSVYISCPLEGDLGQKLLEFGFFRSQRCKLCKLLQCRVSLIELILSFTILALSSYSSRSYSLSTGYLVACPFCFARSFSLASSCLFCFSLPFLLLSFFPESLLFLPLPEILHAEERNGSTVISFDVDLCRQGSGVLELQVPGLLFTKDDVAKDRFDNIPNMDDNLSL